MGQQYKKCTSHYRMLLNNKPTANKIITQFFVF